MVRGRWSEEAEDGLLALTLSTKLAPERLRCEVPLGPDLHRARVAAIRFLGGLVVVGGWEVGQVRTDAVPSRARVSKKNGQTGRLPRRCLWL